MRGVMPFNGWPLERRLNCVCSLNLLRVVPRHCLACRIASFRDKGAANDSDCRDYQHGGCRLKQPFPFHALNYPLIPFHVLKLKRNTILIMTSKPDPSFSPRNAMHSCLGQQRTRRQPA